MATLQERFWTKVDKNGPIPEYRPELGPCWIWKAAINTHGYGQFDTSNAHRVAYELEHGPIMDGLVPDHLCRNRRCVRPSHLEAVTHRTNVLRGVGPAAVNAVKTHCANGHPYDATNTRIVPHGRDCYACGRERAKKWYYKQKTVQGG